MYFIRYKIFLLIVKYILITHWCPPNRHLWYMVIILSVHISGIARTLVSFSGDILKNSESNNTYFSDKVSNFLIAGFWTWKFILW